MPISFLFNDDRHAKIVRAEAKYDDGRVMLRGFEGVPLYDWLNQTAGALVRPKDPLEYLKKLRFHRGISGPAAYGIDV